ncbi:MAG: serine hydrolase domain-containing protein [Polyangiaceae bacterium]
MNTRLFSAAAILATLASSQVASALPSSSTNPRMLAEAYGNYASAELDPALDGELDTHMADIVGTGSLTNGAVLEVARFGKIVYSDAVGTLHGGDAQAIQNAGLSTSAAMATDTIFDLESMTKLTTAALIVRLAELGHLDLNDPVTMYIPEFAESHVYNANFDGWDLDANNDPILVSDADKATVKIIDLLTYRAGTALDAEYWDPVYGSADPWVTMAHVPLHYAPGTTQMYSDLGYRLLGHIAEVAMLAPMHELVRQYITTPMQMTDTAYEPSVYMSGNLVSYQTGAGTHFVWSTENSLDRVAGTGPSSGGVRAYAFAEVQDDNDHWTQRHNTIHKDKYGNVVNIPIGTATAPSGTGCDGLFTTVRDFMKLGQVFLNAGKAVVPAPRGTVCAVAPCVVHNPIFTPADVADMTAVPTPTATFQPLIPSASYPTSPGFAESLVHGHKAFGWELSDGGAFSPSGVIATTNVVTKTGGAGTYIKVDFANDTIAVLLTNHGLPSFDYYASGINEAPGYMISWPAFDDMLDESRFAPINDSIAGNFTCPSCQ